MGRAFLTPVTPRKILILQGIIGVAEPRFAALVPLYLLQQLGIHEPPTSPHFEQHGDLESNFSGSAAGHPSSASVRNGHARQCSDRPLRVEQRHPRLDQEIHLLDGTETGQDRPVDQADRLDPVLRERHLVVEIASHQYLREHRQTHQQRGVVAHAHA